MSDTMTLESRAIRRRAGAVLVATFVLGLVGGAALDRGFGERRRFEPAGGDTLRAVIAEGLPGAFEELDLSKAQHASIEAIFARTRPKTDSMMREMIPRLRSLTDSVENEIRAVLTPEQQRRLTSLRGVRQPMFLLKRRVGQDGPVRVDTIIPKDS